MIRNNHYEVAFEAYLRQRNVGFVAVDETKRSIFGEETVKSADFIIVGPDTAKLVVDVKGRKFPSGSVDKPSNTWQCWSEEQDVHDLQRWARQFGPGFRAVLAFVYHIQPPYVFPDSTPDVFDHKIETYLMRAVDVSEYQSEMRPRSPKWGTVGLTSEVFRRIVKPFSYFLSEPKGREA